MFRSAKGLFCEKALLMKDDRYVLTGVAPALINAQVPPGAQANMQFSVWGDISFETAGKKTFDLIVTGVDGSTLVKQPFEMDVQDSRGGMQFGLEFPVPLPQSGFLVASVKPSVGGPMTEIARIRLERVDAVQAQFQQPLQARS